MYWNPKAWFSLATRQDHFHGVCACAKVASENQALSMANQMKLSCVNKVTFNIQSVDKTLIGDQGTERFFLLYFQFKYKIQ